MPSIINCFDVTTFVFIVLTSLIVGAYRDNKFTAVPPNVSDLPGNSKVLCQGGCELHKQIIVLSISWVEI